MPHKNEHGKIITSKTPILSNHSTKISNGEPLKLCTKMKSKTTTTADDNPEQRAVTVKKTESNHKPSPSGSKNGVHVVAPDVRESKGKEHSNLINKNSLNVQNHEVNSHHHHEAASTTSSSTSRNPSQTQAPPSSIIHNANGVSAEETGVVFHHLDEETPELKNGHTEEENGEEAAPVSPSLKNGFLHFHPSIKDLCDVPCRKDFINTLDSETSRPKKIYRVVLTGGPCGGKTTGQARLCTFFENMGWKVFRVPEAATVLLGGGIKFSELSEDEAFRFQEELLRTMMQIESVFFRMAETIDRDVLIICDRGTMDASAFIKRSYWEDILARNNLNEVDIRDTRYNQIIHMVSAANGAEPFYTTEDHICRSEGLQLARELDKKAAQAWVGHPYFDVVDNSSDFEAKVCRMIQCVCQKLGIDAKDRLEINAKKVKFLVKGPLPVSDAFPSGFQDFTVVHDYLQTNGPKVQARLRKRGQKNHFSYTYTVRRPELQGQVVEVKTTLTQRDYNNMLAQRDPNHVTVYKNRRCFLLNDQYFQLDVYKDPCHPRCKGLLLLETYSTLQGTELYQRLPRFLNIVREVTGDPRYSMFNLSLKERWMDNKNFCQSLTGTESDEHGVEYTKSELQLAGR